MTLSLTLRASREQLPIDTACDVDVKAVLRNDSREPLMLYPGAASFGRRFSAAWIGIEWSVELAGCRAAQPRELRTYYGPPGNPPPPSWTQAQARELVPGGEHTTGLRACWLPNRVLEPRHLALQTLDPQGMDGLASAWRGVELANVSALVLYGRLTTLDVAKDDFLRGHIVGFLEEPRSFELRIGFVQEPWVPGVAKVRSEVASLCFEVG